MEEYDVLALPEVSFSYKINQSRHALTGIDWVKKNSFSPSQHRHGFTHAVSRLAIAGTHVVAVGNYLSAVDTVFYTDLFSPRLSKLVNVFFLHGFFAADTNAVYGNG